MSRISRLTITLIITGLLVLAGASVWAAPIFQGTVPLVPITGKNPCPGTVDLRTALFTCTGGTEMGVVKVDDPAGKYAPAPEGLAYIGDTFETTITPESEMIEVCYAYPPEFENKEAKIYKLNKEASPFVWVEISGAEIKDGVICVTSSAGVFSLIGTP
jgi:hypothetical protein